jgi:hypothetical protein
MKKGRSSRPIAMYPIYHVLLFVLCMNFELLLFVLCMNFELLLFVLYMNFELLLFVLCLCKTNFELFICVMYELGAYVMFM